MPPIHLAGEMAVWSEEEWAAFEGTLQRQLQRQLERVAVRRQRVRAWLQETAAWGLFAATLLLLMFF
jgi:hypothetical protein